MTTVAQIIQDAFRASNLIATESSPTSNEETEALRYLDRIIQSTFGNEAGDKFIDFPIGSEGIQRPAGYPWYDTVPDEFDWFVPENYRLMVNVTQPIEVFLHPEPDDGSRLALRDLGNNLSTNNFTINGNGRHIEGSDNVLITEDSFNAEWFYRGDLGNWVKYVDIGLNDTFPFPVEFDDYFIMSLAMRLNPGYGAQLDPQALQFYNRAKRQLQSRYSIIRPQPSERGLRKMSKMSADRDQWRGDQGGSYNPNVAFSKGRSY